MLELELMTTDAAFWNRIAEKYARQPVADAVAFERKIELTRALMRPEHVVLEIGCGTGSLALRLARSVGRYHGLDISPEMVRIAREKASTEGAENITFHIGPFDESFTVFSPGSLDGLCAYSILHLLGDRPATLRRIFELLEPGGYFVSSTVCLDESWVPYGPLIAVMRWFGRAPRVAVIAKKTLESEIQDAGFVDITSPDVGANAMIAFVVARKPGAREQR